MSAFQERLAIALATAGISQSELARRVKLTRGSVSLWFLGSTKELKGHNLLAAAEALGVNPSWLDTGKGEMMPGAHSTITGSTTATALTKQDFDFIRRVNELPAECRKTLEIVLAEQERLLKPSPRQPLMVKKYEHPGAPLAKASGRVNQNEKKHSNKR